MKGIRRSVFARSFLLPLALLLWLSGCHTWGALEPPFAQTLEETQPNTVRVTMTDGSMLVASNPRVAGDSLTVLVEGPTQWDRGQPTHEVRPVQLPLGGISRLEARHANPVGTVGIVLGATFLILGIAAIAACSGGGCVGP